MELEWDNESESWDTLENDPPMQMSFFVDECGVSTHKNSQTNCLYFDSKGPHHLSRNIAIHWVGFCSNGVASTLRWEQK